MLPDLLPEILLVCLLPPRCDECTYVCCEHGASAVLLLLLQVVIGCLQVAGLIGFIVPSHH
jgi:hypothetical protein